MVINNSQQITGWVGGWHDLSGISDDHMGKCYQGNEADQTTFCHLLLLDSLLGFYTLYSPNIRTEYILCLRFSKTLSFCFAHKEMVFGLRLCDCVPCGSEDTQPKSSASHLEAQPKGRRGGLSPHWNEFMVQKSWHTKTGDKGWQDDTASKCWSFAATPDDLSSVSRVHKAEGENQLPHLPWLHPHQ